MNAKANFGTSSRLSGKVAVVSGAGTYGGEGIGNGAATAILLAREGARVVLVDLVEEWADATKSLIQNEGGLAMSIAADVTKAEQCKEVVDFAVREFNTIDILHNNVGGGSGSGNVVEATQDIWANSMSVNLMSIINMSRYSIPYMRGNSGGSIINVSSVTGMRPKSGRSSAPYTMNKTAVVGLTRAMALDHAGESIRVNCIMPGLIWTPRVSSGSPDSRPTRQSSTPLPNEGESWDIGWAAVYLASDQAKFVTGIVIPVDGGFLLTSTPN
ncbi:MAG: SDR family NAD(P)-dependent oxidoreductase [SAR202 cluster bacterium]|jgi:NAD(P)-dependent dehydrogenase (short-subunit alcohol dehydrogenase family)|nr:SDR family NAD(P)-dependent oxidoreductase [SAR202 cluster bacterium]|tara:strand:- start:4448 stop:5260 length:813 start_codon:yes stop_codon:yes gene_type:complete